MRRLLCLAAILALHGVAYASERAAEGEARAESDLQHSKANADAEAVADSEGKHLKADADAGADAEGQHGWWNWWGEIFEMRRLEQSNLQRYWRLRTEYSRLWPDRWGQINHARWIAGHQAASSAPEINRLRSRIAEFNSRFRRGVSAIKGAAESQLQRLQRELSALDSKFAESNRAKAKVLQGFSGRQQAIERELRNFKESEQRREVEAQMRHQAALKALGASSRSGSARINLDALWKQLEDLDAQYAQMRAEARGYKVKQIQAYAQRAEVEQQRASRESGPASQVLGRLATLIAEEKRYLERALAATDRAVGEERRAADTLKQARLTAQARVSGAIGKAKKALVSLKARVTRQQALRALPHLGGGSAGGNSTIHLGLSPKAKAKLADMRSKTDLLSREKRRLEAKLAEIKERMMGLKEKADDRAKEVKSAKTRAVDVVSGLKTAAVDELKRRLQTAREHGQQDTQEAARLAQEQAALKVKLDKLKHDAAEAKAALKKTTDEAMKVMAQAAAQKATAKNATASSANSAELEKKMKEAVARANKLREQADKLKSQADEAGRKHKELIEKVERETEDKIAAAKQKAADEAAAAERKAAEAMAKLSNADQEVASMKAELAALAKEREDAEARTATERVQLSALKQEVRNIEDRVRKARNEAKIKARAMGGSIADAEQETAMKSQELERDRQKAAAIARDRAAAAEAEKKLSKAVEAQQKALDKLSEDTATALQKARDLRVMLKRAAILVDAKDPEKLGPLQAVTDLAQDLDLGLTTVEGDRKLLLAELADSRAQKKQADKKKAYLADELSLMKKRLGQAKVDAEAYKKQAAKRDAAEKLKNEAEHLRDDVEQAEEKLDEARNGGGSGGGDAGPSTLGKRVRLDPDTGKILKDGEAPSDPKKKPIIGRVRNVIAVPDEPAASHASSSSSSSPSYTVKAKIVGADVDVDDDEGGKQWSVVGRPVVADIINSRELVTEASL